MQFGTKSSARNTTTRSSCILRGVCAVVKGVLLLIAESCRCELTVAAGYIAALQFCVLTLQCCMADDVICEKLQTAPLPDLKVKEVNLQSRKRYT